MTAQIAEIVDVQQQNGQEVLNVFHFLDTTGALTITGLVADYINHVITGHVGVQSNGVSHTSIRYRQVYPTASLQLSSTTGLPLAGTDAGDPCPTSTAYSLAWVLGSGTVNLAGGTLPHIRKGGCRIAGATESNMSLNTVGAGMQTAIASWVSALLSPNADGWVLVVASFLNAARARVPTVQQYAIVTGASEASPSTQNSRKQLRGRNF